MARARLRLETAPKASAATSDPPRPRRKSFDPAFDAACEAAEIEFRAFEQECRAKVLAAVAEREAARRSRVEYSRAS